MQVHCRKGHCPRLYLVMASGEDAPDTARSVRICDSEGKWIDVYFSAGTSLSIGTCLCGENSQSSGKQQ